MNPCPTCSRLTGDVWWGDTMGEARPEPPEFRRMESLPDHVYRCPDCGSYYNLEANETSFLNADYTQYSLSPYVADGPDRIRAATHDYLRQKDLAGLEASLFRESESESQKVILKTLEAYVVEKSLDIGTLEASLRKLLDGEAELHEAGARVLAAHLLRRDRHAEVVALLQRDASKVRRGALAAVWHAATGDWRAGVQPCLQTVRSFLADDDEGIRGNARAILVTAGLQADEAATTIEDAARRLDSARVEERAEAASILAEAAEKDIGDIRPALPRLQELMREKDRARAYYWAQKAVSAALARGINVPGAVFDLAKRLSESKSIDVVHTLKSMQQRRKDISPAFGPLAEMGGSWPLEVLARAAMSGDDLSAAEDRLAELVDKARKAPEDIFAASEARQAIGILGCHYFFRERWDDLRALLGDRTELARASVGEMINHSGRLWDVVAPWEKGKRNASRRKAAAALACLLFFDDRPERIWYLLDSPAADVVSGALDGMLGAARAGQGIEPYEGRLRAMKRRPVIDEILKAAKPAAPLPPVVRTEWQSGDNHCRVWPEEVSCWSGYGHSEVGASCTLKAFLEGDRVQQIVQEIFGQDVFREILAAVKAQYRPHKKK